MTQPAVVSWPCPADLTGLTDPPLVSQPGDVCTADPEWGVLFQRADGTEFFRCPPVVYTTTFGPIPT